MIIKINLETWIYDHTLPNATYIFTHITPLDPETLLDFDQIRIRYDTENDYWYLITFKEGVQIARYDDDEITDEFGNDVIYNCDININIQQNLVKMLNANVIELDLDGLTSLIVYRQISENNVVSKDLYYIDVIKGKFNSAIGVKDIEIDVKDYSLDVNYNYVYIHALKRYYYIDTVSLVSADLTRLYLKEDVLMSHQVLIRSQTGLITRSESDYSDKIADERYPLENLKTVEYITPTQTGTGSLVNTVLDLQDDSVNDNRVAVLGVRTTNIHSYSYYQDLNAPSGTDLPNLSPNITNSEDLYFVTLYDMQFLTPALIRQSDLMTYVLSAVYLPFIPKNTYRSLYPSYPDTLGFIEQQTFQIKDDALTDDYKFHNVGSYPAGVSEVKVATTRAGASPYFIISDFTLSHINNNYLDNEPYSNYEIFVPFVGWVNLNSIQVIDKRIIVYYTLDYHSGMGTAYIYSITDKKLLWSSNCQFGIKLDLTATNQAENNRQKQSNTLNMIMGMIASAVSIGVGVATENPVAIAGGVLSASKTIAGTVNSNMTMFERAQTSFGSGDATFHVNIDVKIRRTYNKEILSSTQKTIYYSKQGRPSNIYSALSSLTGYTEVADIQFKPNNNKIYQVEIAEIVALLKNGVIL